MSEDFWDYDAIGQYSDAAQPRSTSPPTLDPDIHHRLESASDTNNSHWRYQADKFEVAHRKLINGIASRL